jgi:phage terminase large subunit GpA-like protein
MPASAAITQPELFPVVKLCPAEIEAIRPREKLRVSEWAARYREVTEGPWQGLWTNEPTPYLVKPMDTWQLPWVRRLVVVAPPQTGKTQIGINCWAWAQDSLAADTLWVYSDEETAKKSAEERLAKIVKRSRPLRRLMTGGKKDLNRRELKLRTSYTQMAWASSVASLATFSYEHVWLDETDKYPIYKGERESNPTSLAAKRTRTYVHTSKLGSISTPTTEAGYIWQAALKCQVWLVYMARCPKCGELQIMWYDPEPGSEDEPEEAQEGRHDRAYSGLRWPREVTDPEEIEAKGLAWYECEHCGAPWGELERSRAVAAGEYRPHAWDPKARRFVPAEDVDRPISVACWFSALVSPFVPLAETAAQALRAETDPEALHDLFNGYLALPHHARAELSSPDELLRRLCDDRHPDRPGIVPDEAVASAEEAGKAVALIATADAHDWGYQYVIRAWCYGEEGESWLIREGQVESEAALERVIFDTTYSDSEGNGYKVVFGFLDSGYDPDKDPGKIYRWCVAHPPILPSKGTPGQKAQYQPRSVPEHPGLRRVDFNPDHFKSRLYTRISTNPGDPGAWHLYSNGQDEERGRLSHYARQMCSEKMNDKGKWETISRNNHAWDCEVLQLVARELLGLPALGPAKPKPRPKPAPPREGAGGARQRPSWYRGR